MSESLRPDLHEVILDLTSRDTMALLPGETATLTVDCVQATKEPDWVDVFGSWSGPRGDDPHAQIEVRAASLPASGGR